MQRIDDNTYIDDTLVTCAEYQLFIDEMRDQGKFYQPDHWTSLKFPEGEAREPILGVRHSDAESFCEWLTQRENREWQYRLPNQNEVEHFPMKSLRKSPLGYWIAEEYEFAWIGTTPQKARRLDFEMLLTPILTYARTRSTKLIFTDSGALDLDFYKIYANANSLRSSSAGTLENKIAQKQSLARVLTSARTLATRAGIIGFVNDNVLDLPASLLKLEHIHSWLDFDRSNVDTSHPGLARALDEALQLARDTLFDVYMIAYTDLYTLQERIAGRSPAFEGIRLVKERIK